ncbi:MAG: protein GlxC, partial [Mesorhizobium sp.]
MRGSGSPSPQPSISGSIELMPAINVSKATREQDHEQSRASTVFDLAEMPLRELNQALHNLTP